ncbi:HXXEE domain-containing protein [Streptococcus sp. zg-86]|uniref:HXXEE domain-containing protein n=2 Tax=Streptococcus zhangguiae TaxID=2664091 RepID=A0A6I4R7J0_9STRE|nr:MULTISPECIES: HXXEE domain-containing protein [unclassified Streptococcus]MTB63765.1 HXXEE domain-containing protein [Streptococcus sp. zg-86]MTB90075.1 HXXEE domain-containing protein [Streptococcus sp. zg-36]MWV55746.1 HXXEE domain-containing protein [Streptococcus sp. zg-70]
MINYFIRRWYDVAFMAGIVTILFLFFRWNTLDIMVCIQLLSFMALCFHQFEEYHFPGGEPAIINRVFQHQNTIKGLEDRYPLNQFSAMLVNSLYTFILYLLPAFMPNLIWFGMMPIMLGLGQCILHGIVANKLLKTLYNPGLAACLLLHLPIGIYYIYYVTSHQLASGWDWLFGLIYTIGAFLILLNWMTYKVLPNKNSKYPFEPKEMKRFDMENRVQQLFGE